MEDKKRSAIHAAMGDKKKKKSPHKPGSWGKPGEFPKRTSIEKSIRRFAERNIERNEQ